MMFEFGLNTAGAAVRMFCFDGHCSQGRICHKSVMQDHVRLWDFDCNTPPFIIRICFEYVVGEGLRAERVLLEELVSGCNILDSSNLNSYGL